MDDPLLFCLCPRCHRAVPFAAGERYCPNDGARLLTACRRCLAPITSPYVRFCTGCGAPLFEDNGHGADEGGQP